MKSFVFHTIIISVALAFGQNPGNVLSLVKFGLITDIHYCDKNDQATVISVNAASRYYSGGLDKTKVFAAAMNKAQAGFIVELGDYIDGPADAAMSPENKKRACLSFAKEIESAFGLFTGPKFVLGNHDVENLSKEEFSKAIVNTGIINSVGTNYYSFSNGGIHFVVLDADYRADGASYSGNPKDSGYGFTWDDANIPFGEIQWLKQDLAKSESPVIVFTHQVLNPQERIDKDYDPRSTVRNASEVRSVLEEGHVIAVFSGHNHDGGYQQVNGIHYLTLQANAAYGNDASYHNQYALVEVFSEGKDNIRICISGNGLQKSYILKSTLF